MARGDEQNYWQPNAADEEVRQQTRVKSHNDTFVPPKGEQSSAQSPDATETKPQSTPNRPNTSDTPPTPPPEHRPSKVVSWEASEYLHHEKDFWWYAAFAVVFLGLLAVALFFMRSWSFTALIVVMGIAVVFYTQRPPRTLHYTISDKGLYIEDELYPFDEFRAFGVVRDGAFYAIRLVPTKRFSPATFIYFSEEDGEKIVDILGTHLPMQEMKLDLVDTFLRKIRL